MAVKCWAERRSILCVLRNDVPSAFCYAPTTTKGRSTKLPGKFKTLEPVSKEVEFPCEEAREFVTSGREKDLA